MIWTGTKQEVIYPESDGKPMADNTIQAEWIILLYDNLKILLRGQEALVAADLFWYPVEGKPSVKVAPDVLVALGRHGGHRPSYKQWEEGNLAPQVVFEVISPSNSPIEMLEKLAFYDRYGAQEFVVIDPYQLSFAAYVRTEGRLAPAEAPEGQWASAVLGIRFSAGPDSLQVLGPDGAPFRPATELYDEIEQARSALTDSRAEIERLRARLRELGME